MKDIKPDKEVQRKRKSVKSGKKKSLNNNTAINTNTNFKQFLNYNDLRIYRKFETLSSNDLKRSSTVRHLSNALQSRLLHNELAKFNEKDFHLKIQQKLDKYLQYYFIDIDDKIWKKSRSKGFSCEFIKSIKNNKLFKTYYQELFRSILQSEIDDRDKILLKFLIKYQGTPIGVQIHLNKSLQKHLHHCAASLNVPRIPKSYIKNIIKYWPIPVHQILKNDSLIVYRFYDSAKETSIKFESVYFRPIKIQVIEVGLIEIHNGTSLIIYENYFGSKISVVCNQIRWLLVGDSRSILFSDTQNCSPSNCYKVTLKNYQKNLNGFCVLIQPIFEAFTAISSCCSYLKFHVREINHVVLTPISRVHSTYNCNSIMESDLFQYMENCFFKEENVLSQLVKINIHFQYLNR